MTKSNRNPCFEEASLLLKHKASRMRPIVVLAFGLVGICAVGAAVQFHFGHYECALTGALLSQIWLPALTSKPFHPRSVEMEKVQRNVCKHVVYSI